MVGASDPLQQARGPIPPSLEATNQVEDLLGFLAAS
jgi:hypothetical protein